MGIEFLSAEPADVSDLTKAQIRAFHHDAVIHPGIEVGGPPGYDSPDSALERMRDHDYFKIVVDGRIAGGFVVMDEGQGHYYLDLIYVDPDFHNLGIGTEAMDFLETNYSDASRWTLCTPIWATRNRHFYEKLGYVKVGEVQEPDIMLILYEKILNL